MEQQDLHTLRLLSEIEQDGKVSQRTLAKKLGVSLGLVNAFIKRLAKKGYFKIQAVSRKRMIYILTPKGLAEKTRLTYAYVEYSLNLYRTTRAALRSAFHEMESSGVRRIAFFGMGELAEIAGIFLSETNLEFYGLVDPENTGRYFLGKKVLDIEALRQNLPEKLVVCDFTKYQEYESEITQLMDASSIITVPF